MFFTSQLQLIIYQVLFGPAQPDFGLRKSFVMDFFLIIKFFINILCHFKPIQIDSFKNFLQPW